MFAPLLLLIAAAGCMRKTSSGTSDVPRIPGRELVWSDEFGDERLDTTTWNFQLGDGCPSNCGWGNNERQRYTKTNHRVADGYLTIMVRKENDGYTSTRITTRGTEEFRYGRIEARAKLPTGEGIWPAFWMLGSNIGQVGWPLSGEIDILEYVGREPGMVYTTLHTAANHGGNASSKKTPFPDIEQGFHRYATEWTAEAISLLRRRSTGLYLRPGVAHRGGLAL